MEGAEIKCRICGSKEKLTDTWTEGFGHIHEKIQAVTLIENTEWLRFICAFCERRLYDSFDFKQFCTNAYREFLEKKGVGADFGGSASSASSSTHEDFCDDPSENEELTFKLEVEEEAMYTEVVETVRLPEAKVRIERLDTCGIEKAEEAVGMQVEQENDEIQPEEGQPARRKRILKDSSNDVKAAERNTGEDKEGRTSFRCYSCDYKCFSKTALIEHNRSKHQSNSAKKSRKKIHFCKHCRKDKIQFTKQSDFLKHMKFHQRKTCSYCSKVFDSNATLIRHERIHTGEKPFVCKMCPTKTAFQVKSNLNAHIRKIHGVGP